jgi:hypothetical protein
LTGKNRIIYAAVVFFLIVVGVLAVMSSSKGNCWDGYSTEEVAVMACEVHG